MIWTIGEPFGISMPVNPKQRAPLWDMLPGLPQLMARHLPLSCSAPKIWLEHCSLLKYVVNNVQNLASAEQPHPEGHLSMAFRSGCRDLTLQ